MSATIEDVLESVRLLDQRVRAVERLLHLQHDIPRLGPQPETPEQHEKRVQALVDAVKKDGLHPPFDVMRVLEEQARQLVAEAHPLIDRLTQELELERQKSEALGHRAAAERDAHQQTAKQFVDMKAFADSKEQQLQALNDFLETCLCGECGGSGRVSNPETGEIECASCEGTGHDSRKAFAQVQALEARLLWRNGNADELTSLLRSFVDWAKCDLRARGTGPAGGWATRATMAERALELGLSVTDKLAELRRYEHALNDCEEHADLPGIRERTACAVCLQEANDALDARNAARERLEAEKRNQFEVLTWIRQSADKATGIRRERNDKRAPGAKGAVKLLIERYERLRQAARPFVRFVDQWDRKPLTGIDDEFYAVHSGTEFEASLRMSELRELRKAVADGRTEEGPA